MNKKAEWEEQKDKRRIMLRVDKQGKKEDINRIRRGTIENDRERKHLYRE